MNINCRAASLLKTEKKQSNHYAVILAGGDGSRLLTHRVEGLENYWNYLRN